jgi:hypothetical protein
MPSQPNEGNLTIIPPLTLHTPCDLFPSGSPSELSVLCYLTTVSRSGLYSGDDAMIGECGIVGEPITVAARSSLPQKLVSWVRIPLEAHMSVCVYSVVVET